MKTGTINRTRKSHLMAVSIAILLLSGACNKSEGIAPGGGTGFETTEAPGVLYIKQGREGITRFDLATGTVTNVIPHWLDAGWDISRDGSFGVKQVNESTYDTRYMIFSTASGAVIREVRYQPNDNHGGLPLISPDGTKLALQPEYEDGLVILDMNGNVLHNISGYGTHEFKWLDDISWEPGGTILFKKDNELWRTTTDFSRATRVCSIPFDDWTGYAAASPDGQKLAVSAGNHIYLMNSDGSAFRAVTESDQREVAPAFSPDSKYIAMKANSRAPMQGDAAGNAFHICIIPADGQVYRVWPGEDNRVIHPMVAGEPSSRGLGKTIVGDFVWR